MKEQLNISFKEAYNAFNLYSKKDRDTLANFFTYLSKLDVHSLLSAASLEDIKKKIYNETSQDIVFEFLTFLNTRLFINNVTEEMLCDLCRNNLKIYNSKSVSDTLYKTIVSSDINVKYFENDRMLLLIYLTRLHINNLLFLIKERASNE